MKMKTVVGSSMNFPITERFPNPICFHGLLNMREETRTDLMRYKYTVSVTEYAERNALDPEAMVSEHQTMKNEKTDFETAFTRFFDSENIDCDFISYERIKLFVKQYSIRYNGTISKAAMERGMKQKGYHLSPSLYRKIDLEIWKSDSDMTLEAYIPCSN